MLQRCQHIGGVAENHPEADFIFAQSSASGKVYVHNLLDSLGIRIPKESVVHGGMTVAMLSIQIANLMGASEVIMVGQDLAYESASSHLEGSDHASGVRIVKRDGTDEEYFHFDDYGGKKNALAPIFWVKGWKRGKVPTTKQFVAYISFMNRFFRTTGLKPINCTEGGSRIEACKQMTLKDAYAKYIKPNKVSKKKVLVERNRVIDREKLSETIEMVKGMVKEFKHLRSIARAGTKEFKKKKPDYDVVNRHVKELMSHEYANYISQNNYPGYYLFNYLKLANGSNKLTAAINRRNRARLLFDTMNIGMSLFIKEYERMLERISAL